MQWLKVGPQESALCYCLSSDERILGTAGMFAWLQPETPTHHLPQTKCILQSQVDAHRATVQPKYVWHDVACLKTGRLYRTSVRHYPPSPKRTHRSACTIQLHNTPLVPTLFQTHIVSPAVHCVHNARNPQSRQNHQGEGVATTQVTLPPKGVCLIAAAWP
jgi:hypothetical protein